MGVVKGVTWWTLLLLVAGCTSQGVVQGMYEGARVRNQIQSAPSERVGKPELPSDYQSYDAMRRESAGREMR